VLTVSLSQWQLNLDIGTLTLTVQNAPGITFTGLDCSQFTIVDDNVVNPPNQYQLRGCENQRLSGVAGLQFDLTEADLRALKLNQNLATSEGNTYLSIATGNGILDSSNDDELLPLSFDDAEQASFVQPDITRPEVVDTGFLSFDLDSGEFNILFNEPVDVSTFNVNENVGFQHFYDIQDSSDYYSLQSALPVCPNCVDDENITLRLGTEDLNNIKLNPRICMSGADCWLTIPETGQLVQDMAGNQITPLPDGLRSGARLVQVFTDDTTGPTLESFILNMTSRELKLTFDEPVDVSSFDISGVTIVSRPGVTDASLSYNLQSGTVLTPNGVTMTTLLSDIDVNELQSRPTLATRENNTYISLSASTVIDLSHEQNPVQPIFISDSMQADLYIPDLAPPELEAFDLDLNANQLSLYFNEPVLQTSLNISQLTLQSTGNGNLPSSVTRPLTGGEILPELFQGSAVVTFNLTDDDVAFLELSGSIATTENNVYISAHAGFVRDTNNISSDGIPLINGLQVSQFITDTTAVNFISFTLDMNLGEMNLTFDDAITISTFQASAISLQSGVSRVGPDFVSLTSSSNGSSIGGFQVAVNINSVDLNRIKQTRLTATRLQDTFITVMASVVDDAYGIDCVAVTDGKAIQASLFIPDTTNPQLDSFVLDVNEGLLILFFTETVDIFTFNITELSVQPQQEDGTESYQLNIADNIFPSDADYSFSLLLSSADINYIKQQTGLGIFINNTYLTITSSAVFDMNMNRVIAIENGDALMAASVIPDVTSPTLESFTLDMDSGIMRFTFSETVNASSFDLRRISLVNRGRRATSNYTLQRSTGSTEDSTIIEVTIAKPDLDAIKSKGNLATSAADTFVVASVVAIVDMNGNQLVEIHEDTAQQVSMYSRDETKPRLVNFMLNLTANILRLSFSETVRSSSLDPTQLTIQNTVDGNDLTRILTGGIQSPADTTYIDLTLTAADLNNLKLFRTLATRMENSYLSFTETAVRDMAGNLVIPIEPDNAEQASIFFPDMVPPMLSSFDLNLQDHLLVLTFDETVDTSTFSIISVSLQERQSNPTQTVSLSSGSSTSSPDGVEVVIALSINDFNSITATFPLASMNDNTFITLAESTVSDTNGNPSIEVSSDNALQITNHTADQTSPTLVNFDLDADSGVLTLVFSESVNASSFIPSQVTLQNMHSSPTEMYSLTGGDVNQPFSTTVALSFTRTDLNLLKANLQLATEDANTYLSITESGISDMNRNMLVRVPMSDAQNVGNYISDASPPIIESFTLDYNTGAMVVFFDETVDVNSVDVTDMTLQSSMSSPSEIYMLMDSNITNSGLVTDVYIQLSITDFNGLKRSGVCVSQNSCYMSVTQMLIQDAGGNYNQIIPLDSAVPVDVYTPDTTDPYIVHYTEFDLNSGIFTVEFSEHVNTVRFNPSTLGFFETSDEEAFSISTQQRVTVIDANALIVYQFQLNTNLLNEIKLQETLCTSIDNCFIRFNVTFVRDRVGNYIEAIEADPLLPSHILQDFVPDTTRPVLQSFNFDLNQGLMKMTFDEVVNINSFDPRLLTFQNTFTDPTVTFNPRMPGTHSRSENGLEVSWMMDMSDLILLKAHDYLYNSEGSSYLTFTGFIQDVSRNSIASTLNESGMRVNVYGPDIVNPKLVSFSTLNFNNGSFSVLFDEPVNISCIQLDQFFFFHNYSINTNPPRTYLNSSLYMLYPDGAIANDTHVFQEGEYILNCSSNFNLTDNSTYVNETIYPISLEACNITLNETIVQGVHLTGGEVEYVDERKLLILIHFNAVDLREVKLDQLNGTAAYLSFSSDLIKDFANNYVVNISNTNATLVREFIPDTTVATFLYAALDMDSGILSLFFNDIINSTSVNPNVITISNGLNNTHSLVAVYPINPFESDYGIHIPLEPFDLNAIKINTELATEEANSYVLFGEEVAHDLDGRNVTGVATESFTMVENYTIDTTGPVLMSIALDLNTGMLNLTFDEAVIPSSYYPPGFVIRNVANCSHTQYIQSHALTGGEVALEDNSTGAVTITIGLSRVDVSALQSMVNLTTDKDNSYARVVLTEAVEDVNGNLAIITGEDEAVPTTDFINDTSNPTLLSFDLDLNDNFLILSFSEAVMPYTLNLSGILLANESNITSRSIRLTVDNSSQYFTSDFDATIHIRLTVDDQEFLKENSRPIAKSASDIFLLIENATVFDYVELPLLPLPTPIAVTNYFEGKLVTCTILH